MKYILSSQKKKDLSAQLVMKLFVYLFCAGTINY